MPQRTDTDFWHLLLLGATVIGGVLMLRHITRSAPPAPQAPPTAKEPIFTSVDRTVHKWAQQQSL